jgi:glucosamine 6-phosphate synthetase-like amidotransferase/phosphosugar isomerase protein
VPAAAVAVGGGAAWAAALELALMLKEITRIPAEGVETREGATSAMFGLDRGHLMISLDPPGDQLGDEALRLCAATGAATLRLPVAAGADARLAPITTVPASAALAAELALAAGHDVDNPSWTDAYYETARSAT